MGPIPGARIVECDGIPAAGSHRLHQDEVVVIDARELDDANEIARFVLGAVGADPSAWWIAMRGLEPLDPDVAERRLEAFVDGVRHVRLYLAKQQFD